jgi:transposase
MYIIYCNMILDIFYKVWYGFYRKHFTMNDAKDSCWIRKTYSQRVTLGTMETEVLASVNQVLIELWNEAIAQVNTWLDLPKDSPEKRPVTHISLCYWLTEARKRNPNFASVSVVIEREMLRRLAGGFTSYFTLLKKKDKKARPPSPRDMEKSFIALTWTEKSFQVSDGLLSSSIGSKRIVTFSLGEYIMGVLGKLPEGSKVAQVTVSKRDGVYWANFVCNIPTPPVIEPEGIIAIDLGSGDIVCSCSDGREFSFPARRPDKLWRRRINSVEERVAKCKKGSRAWHRRMNARRTMHNKSQYQHTDHQRKLANWLVGLNMTIVVGKMKTRLGLSKSSGTPQQHWGVQNTGYSFRLLVFLREKAAERGLRLMEFPDPPRDGSLEDPTSKFNAARKLLKLGCNAVGSKYPSSFTPHNYSLPQG